MRNCPLGWDQAGYEGQANYDLCNDQNEIFNDITVVS